MAVISRPHPVVFLRALTNYPTQAARSGHHQKFQSLDAADGLLANDAANLRKMYSKWEGVPDADVEAYLSTLGDRAVLDAAINWYRAVRDTAINILELPAIAMPTLYVWGTGDTTVGRIAAEGTGETADGPSEFGQIPEVGHIVTDEAPGVFTDLLLEPLRIHA